MPSRSRPWEIIAPQEIVSCATPTPRKLSPASAMMTVATLSVARITIELTRLGRMCRTMMRMSLAPMVRAAMTNSRSRRPRVSARTMRAQVAPEREDEHDDDVGQAGPPDRGEEDGHEDGRQGELQVDQRHDDAAGPAAEPPAQHAEQRPDERRDGDDEPDGDEGHAGAVDQAAEGVAPQVVGAQGVIPGAAVEDGGLQAPHEVEGVGIVGCQRRADDAENDESDEERDRHAERLGGTDVEAAAAAGGSPRMGAWTATAQFTPVRMRGSRKV